MKKRLISLIMIITMICSFMPITAQAKIIDNGQCGDNVYWELDDEGTLTISGAGNMYYYSSDYGSKDKSPFYKKTNIKNVIIKDGVTKIGPWTFYGCSNLISAIIPDSVTTIEYSAFAHCSNLISINIPPSVTTIEAQVFLYCSSLKSINIPPGVTTIENSAFSNCSSLESVILPDSILSIGEDAFQDCSELKSINIPPKVTTIKHWTFYRCSSLISISIPPSVTTIDIAAFYGCSSLKSVKISPSVTTIGNSAFSNCSSLESIKLPDYITKIGLSAFENCNNLTSINIPLSITNIERWTFNCCDNLTNIYYSGTVQQWKEISIGEKNDILKSVTIHYNSYNEYIPANVNPARPSEESNKTYGVNISDNKKIDVCERLKNSADTFNKAALEYTDAVSKSAKKQAGAEGDVESLAKKLEAEYDKNQKRRILFEKEPDSKMKRAAFMGYAQWLNQMIEEAGIEKINLSENSVMIDYKLTSQILSKLRRKNLSYDYNGYKMKINGFFYSSANFGYMDITPPRGSTIRATLSSDPNQTMADLQDFANQLKDVAQDVNKKALRAVVSDLINLTGLGNLGTLITRDGLKSYKPLTKLGYGDVVKNVKKCYSGYEAVKGILNCTQIDTLDSIIDNPQKLSKKLANLCEQEGNIENAVVNAAQNKLIDSLYNLLYASQDYEEMRNGKQPTFQERVKDFFDKTTSWVSSIFQCPIDFTVYDENGEMIGYVDDGAVYYNDDIYIEVSGDVKTLYVPVGMKVDIKMIGTDEGEFNYIVEEVIYNQPTGRLNYYGLPLSEGTEYTQSLDTTEFDNSTDVLPIISLDGNVLPNEYISSEDTTAYVIINADSDNGGTVLGDGEYAKGDSVELSAVPINSNYEFNGWYVGDELISVDNIYRFTAIENTDIHAEFMRVYNEDNAYEMEIPDTADDIYSYIYKDDDGSKGVVLVPFTEEIADSIQIYVTTYSTDGSILNSDILCSATLNENGIYAFENIDLENAAKVVIKDENNIEIASADYDSSRDIPDIGIEVSDKYSDSLNVTACEEFGNVIVNFDILDDKINQNDIVAYLAEYDENSILLNCTILDETTTDNGIEFDVYLGDNYKLMFWNNNMCPITEAITTDLFEI